MKEKFLTKGNVMLFAIAFAVTVIVALVCNLCGAERITVEFAGAMGGILAVLGIGGLYEVCSQKAPMGPEAGILGVVVGVILNIILF